MRIVLFWKLILMDVLGLRKKLEDAGLKITPQRLAILEAVYNLDNHPTTENIIEYIRTNQPNIASGTVYKVLDTLVANGLIAKVKTEKDIMRYDGIVERHHHLYCLESDRIDDYTDRELDRILEGYFNKKKIPGFRIDEINLQIKGKFLNLNKNERKKY
jgi:Fur family peroxide stress response transcriptional regulator